MCTRKQKNVEPNLDCNTLVRPSPFRRAVAWITLIAYVGQPLLVTAQVTADQAAAASKRPVVDVTANGIPLIQIAAPNAAGLSHNQYTQFNVDPAGVILNNSQTTVLTQQAGYVAGNQNLANGAASVILNEVTSTSRSQLNGYTEVAGQQAEVIIANPNGITCNGCGFINASRGVLTTGTPVMGASGSLDALRVTGGDIQIGSSGLNGSNLSQLDLIARSIQVNGQLWGTNLNVITGANLANYNTLGVQVIQGTGAKPTVGIDIALLGGMYANKIRLIGTEAGVGVNSLGNLSAQAGDFVLDNQGQITLGGNTTSSGNLSITSNASITNSGTLYSQQAAQLTGTGSIINSGLLSAQGNLTLNAASLNSTGALGAGIDVNGNASKNGNLNITTSNQTTATGTNIAGGSMRIAATSINLAGSQTSAWSGIDLNATAGNIDLTSAKTQSVVGNIALNATGAVNNTSGLLFGAQITSNAASFNNTSGSVGAFGNISLTAGSIANTNGKIGNALNGAGNIALTTTGTLTNTAGQIGSDQDLSITASTIIGNGQSIAKRDASISLQGNYTNAAGNVFKANRNLTVTTTGNFTNQTALEALGKLTLNAANITNQAGAGVNSAWTLFNTTGDITNAGRIEGNTVETHSNNFTNTATVIGNVLNLYANNLNNLNAAALIGATQSVNLIIANALNNQDGATLYSLGDINIGSSLALNANGYLSGNAASVTNQSATIEAMGNLRISANTITNKRTAVGVQWGPSWTGAYVPGNPRYTPTYADQQFTAATTPAAQMLSGASMKISGGALTNDYSNIIAGGALTSQLTTLTNSGAPFQRSETRVGQQDSAVWQVVSWSCNIIGRNCSPNYAWVPIVIPYAATIYTNIPGSVNVSYLQNTPHGGTPHTVSTQTVTAGGVTNVSNTGSLPALTAPASGLYTIHSQPGQKYLVVTDPRFASYANFISSDYMLSRLALDPQMIQKRLGDGFYEQKLVTDQVTAATGRRYLGGYADAQSQFIALLDSGVDAAKEFKLAPGVALTATQINALKHDIVWMVERDVTLPDGTTERVLAPQVYLTRLHEGDLKPSGALIAANDISINANSDITNSGTIQGYASTVLIAQDIINRGGLIGSQGFTLLNASNDILNLSGQISGNTVGLTAGRDIRVERTSRDVTRTVSMDIGPQTGRGLWAFRQAPVVGVVSGTELGLESGINATGSLSMNAGRDISLVAAAIKSGGDATINAGRDLNASVLTAKESSSTARYAASRTNVMQLASSIQTGGNLNLSSGNNMRLTSAALDVGKDATLVAGGDLTLDASKNSSTFRYNTGSAIGRFNDETVLGSTLNAGGNVTLVATQLNTAATTQASGGGSSAGRTDGRGNITLQSTDITSKTGQLTVAADANVNIGTTEENHNAYTESHATGSGLFTHTTLDVRNESWRTDNVGSNLSADSISITSGKNIGVVGSTASAEHNINVAAMGDVNISAATNTYGAEHYSHETTTGLQIKDAFNITDQGPDITSKSRTDGTKQSYNRSSLTSNSGNLNIMAGGNLIASGTDLAANAGDLALLAGGSVALLAGQDTLNQSSSTLTVTNPNFFTKQRHTITDTSARLDSLGSTAQGNSVKVTSGNDIVLQAAQLTAGAGGINLDAGGDLKLLAAANSASSKHTETLSTDGMTFRANGTSDKLSDRRLDNATENQQQTAQVTRLSSAGDIATHSARDTLIEASQLNAQGAINLSAGNAATYNTDGSLKAPATEGKITLATVKDSDYLSIAEKGNSLLWQSQSGSGHLSETVKLANISAGKGLNINASGGVIVDIPDVPATPAPEHAVDAQGNPIPVKPLTPEQQAAQQQADLDKHINNLASKPGQEWIGQLAQMAKDKPDSIKLQQVNAAMQHWDYSHDGLTPEAAAVVVIVVAYFTAGAGSGAVGTTTATAGTTTTAVGGTTLATTATTTAGVSVTTYTVAGAAINAGISTLASQASLALINNKGDLGKTLDDMGKSENVRNIVAAMLTAGVGTLMPSTNMTGVLAQTASGCATGEMVGIGCERGATNAAVTSGAALAYTTMVGYAADLRPGENRNGTKADGTSTGNATYVPVPDKNSPTFGQQLPADVGMNVIGFNEPGSIGSQGEVISKVLNQVPFINATAGLHDYIFNANLLTQSTFNNIWTMGASALLTIPASLNDPSLSWLFINGMPYSLNSSPKPPLPLGIISVPSTTPQSAFNVNVQGRMP